MGEICCLKELRVSNWSSVYSNEVLIELGMGESGRETMFTEIRLNKEDNWSHPLRPDLGPVDRVLAGKGQTPHLARRTC